MDGMRVAIPGTPKELVLVQPVTEDLPEVESQEEAVAEIMTGAAFTRELYVRTKVTDGRGGYWFRYQHVPGGIQ